MKKTTGAALLSGGESRRMGTPKADLLVDGTPLAQRIADGLATEGIPVVVLGRQPVAGYPLLLDEEEFQGPLAALARFQPEWETVFVVSCDLPWFDQRIVAALSALLGEAEAAVPVLDGFRQPLCALYRAEAFALLPEVVATGRRSMMAWLDRLTVVEVGESDLRKSGLDPLDFMGANTPEEFEAAIRRKA